MASRFVFSEDMKKDDDPGILMVLNDCMAIRGFSFKTIRLGIFENAYFQNLWVGTVWTSISGSMKIGIGSSTFNGYMSFKIVLFTGPTCATKSVICQLTSAYRMRSLLTNTS